MANKFVEQARAQLVGKRITNVYYMEPPDADAFLWHKRPIVIELEDDQLLIPQADDEGNDGGALLVGSKDYPTLVLPTF